MSAIIWEDDPEEINLISEAESDPPLAKKPRLAEKESPSFTVCFDPFGTEAGSSNMLKKQGLDYVNGLTDAEFRLLTSLLKKVLNQILKESKLAKRVSGQTTIALAKDLNDLPLRGIATVKAVSEKLAIILQAHNINPTLGGNANGELLDAVVTRLLSRVSTVSHKDSQAFLPDYDKTSQAIVLISPAVHGFDSLKTPTGRLLRSVATTVTAFIKLIHSRFPDEQFPDAPEHLLVCNVVGHCAREGLNQNEIILEATEDEPETENKSEEVIKSDAADAVVADDGGGEAVLKSVQDVILNILQIANETEDEIENNEDDALARIPNVDPSSSSLDSTTSLSSSSFSSNSSSSSSSSSASASSSISTRGLAIRGDGSGPGLSAAARPPSSSGTSKEHRLRLNHYDAMDAMTRFMIEQLRAECPQLHAVLCSKRLKDVFANLSTKVALDAIGKLCHPCRIWQTEGSYDLLVVTLLRTMGFPLDMIFEVSEVATTGRSSSRSIDVTRAGEKLAQEVRKNIRSIRTTTRTELNGAGPASRSANECIPETSIMYPFRKIIELQLRDHLGTGPGQFTHFNDAQIEELVKPMWDKLQADKELHLRESWTPEHSLDARKAWSGNKATIKNLMNYAFGYHALPDGNPIKKIMNDINKSLRKIVVPHGEKRGKKSVTPGELLAIIADVLKRVALDRPPTNGDMNEAYIYWSPGGTGLKHARRGAGDSRQIITSIQKGIRDKLRIVRQRKKLSPHLTSDEKVQLLDATLEALNEKDSTTLSELPEDISKAVVMWAEDKTAGQGRDYLGGHLNL